MASRLDSGAATNGGVVGSATRGGGGNPSVVGESKESDPADGASTAGNTAATTTTTTTAPSWRVPSVATATKFRLVALPDDFEPTPQEQALLQMYQIMQAHERKAANLRKQAALRKLADRDTAYKLKQQQQQQQRKTNRHKKTKKAAASNDDDDDDDDDSDDDDDDDDLSDDDDDDMDANSDEDEEEARRRRRNRKRGQAKLDELRQQVEEYKRSEEDDVQDRINEQLESLEDDDDDMDDEDDDDGMARAQPVLRKRARKATNSTSLIANLQPLATPPHDFSSKLQLATARGKVLFPPGDGSNNTDDDDLLQLARMGDGSGGGSGAAGGVWTPPAEGAPTPNHGAFCALLDDFDVDEAQNGSGANNTLAIRFAVPGEAKRFSFNIATADQIDAGFDSILFHFNPRQHERGGQVVMNDKQDGIWGQALAIPLSQLPLLFGQDAITLIIQIHGDGFDVFLENKHCARLEHRRDLSDNLQQNLALQFPSTDDYGSPENWKVYKVWWGHKPLMAKEQNLSSVAGVNSFNSVHPRKLFIRGLSKIHTPAEVDLRRAELERAFLRYGGQRGVNVKVYAHKTYASVEMESERQTDLALREMAGRYQLHRARRSRYEALQEERAAKEQQQQQQKAAGGGGRRRQKEATDWD